MKANTVSISQLSPFKFFKILSGLLLQTGYDAHTSQIPNLDICFIWLTCKYVKLIGVWVVSIIRHKTQLVLVSTMRS